MYIYALSIRMHCNDMCTYVCTYVSYFIYTDTNPSEVEEKSLQNFSKAVPPTEYIIPIAGLGMELHCLLKQDCSVPFDFHFQLDDGSLLGAHSVVVCAKCSWFMNALER